MQQVGSRILVVRIAGKPVAAVLGQVVQPERIIGTASFIGRASSKVGDFHKTRTATTVKSVVDEVEPIHSYGPTID